MIKSYCKILSGIFILTFLLFGCAADTSGYNLEETPSLGNLLSTEPEYLTAWPENDMTAHILQPENGEIDYVRDASEHGCYEIVMKEISKEESAAYLEKLQDEGYVLVFSEENEASAGMVLRRESVVLNVAYSENVLNMVIAVDDPT